MILPLALLLTLLTTQSAPPPADQKSPRGSALFGLPLPPTERDRRPTPLHPPSEPAWVEGILSQHPDHGEARLARLEWALAWARYPASVIRPGIKAPPLLSAMAAAAPTVTILEAWNDLMKVPDWPWQVDLPSLTQGQWLPWVLGGQPIEAAAKEVVQALAADPANARLQENLAFLHRQGSTARVDARCEDWEAVVPLPGQLWPPLPLIRAHLDYLLRLERCTEVQAKAQAWSRPASRVFLNRNAWHQRLYREALLRTYVCISNTRTPNDRRAIRESLEGIRETAGPDYRELAGFYVSRIKVDDPDIRKEIRLLLDRPALPGAPMPTPLPPWHLEVQDAPRLQALRAAFDQDQNLRLWLPSERELALNPSLPGPLDVWLGDHKIWASKSFPNQDTLSGLLGEGRRGRLRMATDQVERMSEHPGRRRFRVPLLLERMPLKALEEVLAEDLSRTLSFAQLPETPFDENLWFYAARLVLPRLEEHLGRWPLDGERWEALAFWSAFIPHHPGPGSLADAQPAWQARLPFRLGLPPAFHEHIGAQLARRQAWAQARAWFEPAWEELRHLEPQDLPRWPWLRLLEPVLRDGLDAAYRGLGQEGLRRALHDSSPAPPPPMN